MSGGQPRARILDQRALDATRFSAARLLAIEAQPYLAEAVFALTPIPVEGQHTFSVDAAWRLYVDVDALRTWSVPECAGVILHEVGHLVRAHSERAQDLRVDATTAECWNLAADAEINDDLRSDRVRLPGSPILPETFGEPPGRVAEYYFARLSDRDELPEHAPDCGSGAHGVEAHDPRRDRAGLGPTSDDAGSGHPAGASDRDEVSRIEALMLRRKIAETVIAMASSGPRAGTMPGGWLRWAEALVQPVIDWRTALRGVVRGAIGNVRGAVDYSYARPSRRHVPRVVLPSMVRPLPRVAIIVDTSGSVTQAALGAAWSEVHGCLRSLGVRRDLLQVYAADTEVVRVHGLGADRAKLYGGGGTDMAHAIDETLRARPRPDVVVVLTDGFTPWPATRPDTTVIVGLLPPMPGFGSAPDVPAWARVVVIPDADPAGTPVGPG